MKLKLRSQQGFTLVELMLAMVLFSAVLVISTVGFIGMNRTFSRGVIKKQLSESVQTITEDMGRALRAQPNSNVVSIPTCSGGVTPAEKSCPSYLAGWNTLKIGTICYLWQGSGMYRSTGVCDDAEKKEILDSRYVVKQGPYINIVGSGSGLGLYKVSGVFTTDQMEAIHTPTVEDPSWHCRGSAESSFVATCAVQEFSIIINPQGSAI